MTPPRFNFDGQVLFVTVQAANCSARFWPTKNVRRSIRCLLAYWANHYGLLVHDFEVLGDRLHLVVTDPRGMISDFEKQFHSHLSRQLNEIRKTSGANFARDPSLLHIADDEGVVDRCIYTVGNAARHGLVDDSKDWKGPNSLALEYGEAVEVRRPKCGLWRETRGPGGKGPKRYRGRSKVPEIQRLTLVRPPVRMHLDDRELRASIRREVAARDAAYRAERETKKTSTQVRGRARTPDRKPARTRRRPAPRPYDLPGRRPERSCRGRVTGCDVDACNSLRRTIRRFELQHRVAARAYPSDPEVEFPFGTLQMRRRFGVRCAQAPP